MWKKSFVTETWEEYLALIYKFLPNSVGKFIKKNEKKIYFLTVMALLEVAVAYFLIKFIIDIFR